jgi:serine/threonine protein kinase
MELKSGQIFSNHYKLIEQVGVGGFSEVWKAADVQNPSLEVAIKIFSGLDSQGVKQFSSEYANVFKLNNTHILTAKNYDTWERYTFLVFPYCEKGSLRNTFYLKKTFNPAEIREILKDIVSGLVYLHKNEIIHNDLKPENFLLSENGDWMITDFGISVNLKATMRKSMQNASTTSGAPPYMSPEALKGKYRVSTATDIFSLGVVIYEMCFGDVPWSGLGGNALKDETTPLPELPEDFDADLNLLMQSCMQYNPDKRPTAKMIYDFLFGKSNIKSILIRSGLKSNPKKVKFFYQIFTAFLLLVFTIALVMFSYKRWNKKPDPEETVTIVDTTKKSNQNKIIDNVDTLHSTIDIIDDDTNHNRTNRISEIEAKIEAEKREKAEREKKEKEKEKAAREAQERAEREAQEAKEKAEREARDKAEREAQAKLERERREEKRREKEREEERKKSPEELIKHIRYSASLTRHECFGNYCEYFYRVHIYNSNDYKVSFRIGGLKYGVFNNCIQSGGNFRSKGEYGYTEVTLSENSSTDVYFETRIRENPPYNCAGVYGNESNLKIIDLSAD